VRLEEKNTGQEIIQQRRKDWRDEDMLFGKDTLGLALPWGGGELLEMVLLPIGMGQGKE